MSETKRNKRENTLMIRQYNDSDIEPLLDIWLSASIAAHDFVDPSFWRSQLGNMRDLYIPMAEVYVYEMNSEVVGFSALHEDRLAALFVPPALQGKGIGKQLLMHAKRQRAQLSLSVYKDNDSALQFYLSQGFTVISEQQDEHTGCLECTMSTTC